MHAWILADGRLTLTPAVRALARPDLVVAADGGARHAALLNVAVDAWVGDFDSSMGLEVAAPREVHPAAKDQTDTELAIAVARARGASQLTVLGAFGGRFDHTAAVVLGCVRLAMEGLAVTLHSGDESGHPLGPACPVHLDLPADQTLSVLALSEVQGLDLTGVRWPLSGAHVPMGSGWTVSNETRGGNITATVREGLALVTVLWPTQAQG